MLFGEKLQKKISEYGQYWPNPPLGYTELKRLLYDASSVDDAQQRRKAFFVALQKELRRVNTAFERLAKAAVREHRRRDPIAFDHKGAPVLTSKWSLGLWLSRFSTKGDDEPKVSLSRVCNEYARINATGVHKILKKCDKVWGGTQGAEFWSKMWSDQSRAVAFVHSPTRVQIDAIESIDAWINDHPSTETPPINADSTAHPPEKRFIKTDLQCPICLDALFKPVVLSCGHVYCFPCLLTACHLGKAVGTMQALMSNIDPDKPCAKCRQTGVYRGAVVVPELETCVRLQFPEAWKERQSAETKAEVEKRAKLEQQKRERLKDMGLFIGPGDLFV